LQLPETFTEFHRVLAPGALLLLAFQVGDERVHLDHAYGHALSLDAYRLSPDRIEAGVGAAGFEISARTVRGPNESEKTPQAYVLARKPADPDH
jgi:hypothetical protein